MASTAAAQTPRWTKVGNTYVVTQGYGDWHAKAVVTPQPSGVLVEMRTRTITGEMPNGQVASEAGRLELVTIAGGQISTEEFRYTQDASGEKRQPYRGGRNVSLIRTFRAAFRNAQLPVNFRNALATLPNWWPTDNANPSWHVDLDEYRTCSARMATDNQVVFAAQNFGGSEDITVTFDGQRYTASKPRWIYHKGESTVGVIGSDLFADYEQFLTQIPEQFRAYVPALNRARGK